MNYENMYRFVKTPVVVYRMDDVRQVLFENKQAQLAFNPTSSSANWEVDFDKLKLHDLVEFDQKVLEEIEENLKKSNEALNYFTEINLPNQGKTPVEIYGYLNEDEAVLFFYLKKDAATDLSSALTQVLDIAIQSESSDKALDNILAFSGNYLNVSRSYIFEETSEIMTSNTYEWCAPGVEPAIEFLVELPKADYSYDNIMKLGLAITNDVRQLNEEDRAILEPQGIKSMAVIPMFTGGKALGYVGFDDCEHYRTWTQAEANFLQGLADVCATYVTKRKQEEELLISLQVLNHIADNFNNTVLITDVESGELLFVNRSFTEMVKLRREDLIGKHTADVIDSWANSPGIYDSLSQIESKELGETRSWEFFNENARRWFMIKSEIITWIDGRLVLVENAHDITEQKATEDKLKRQASTDMMTGVYNREFGDNLLKAILEDSEEASSCLVFMDLDGLKQINDEFGHASGDVAILKLVELIKTRIRRNDVVIRWGGDEFCIIVRANLHNTQNIMNEIYCSLDAFNSAKSERFTLSFSYGIVEIDPTVYNSVEDLVNEADSRMYKFKKQAR